MGVFSTIQTLTGDPFRDTLITVLGQTDEDKGFILNKVSPSIFVDKTKASFPILSHSDKIKNTAPRVDSQPAPSTLKLGLTQVPYQLKAQDERLFLSNTELKSDQVKSEMLKIAAGMALGELINLKAEYMFLTKITNAANYPSAYKETVPDAKKFNYVNGGTYSDPITYLVEKAGIARLLFSMYADMIIFSESSWETFCLNPNVRDALGEYGEDTVTPEVAVKILKKAGFRGLKYLFISGAIHDENVNKKTRSAADIMQDDVIIGVKAEEIGAGMVKAGAFITAISDDPDDIGSMEYEGAEKIKGIWVENRLSLDNCIVANKDEANNDMLYAMLLKATNVVE